MKRLPAAFPAIALSALLCLAGADATAATYTTNFPLTENPISESGHWIGGKTVGLAWSDFQSTPGFAFGKEPGNSPGLYDDAIALLAGAWGPDQTVQATVKTVNQNDSIFEELEIRLRSTVTANSSTGYECNFSARSSSNAYLQIVRWNGPFGSFTLLDARGGSSYGINNGDTIKCMISGSTITAYVNGAQKLQVVDSTYTSGNPGMGAYLQNATGVNADYGFTNFTASDGLSGALPQTITFNPLPGKTFGDVPFTVTATASSGLPVSFSSLSPGVCTVSGNTVTIVAAGMCTIAADQAGNATYLPAPRVTNSFTVAQKAQTITFNALPNRVVTSAPFTLSATASSGLTVSFSSLTPPVCTVGGMLVTLVTTGTCTVGADQAGNANFAPAPQVTRSFTVLCDVNASGDCDNDGIPNAVEFQEGTNPLVKDNDVFGNARLFTMQQYRDFLSREGDPAGITGWTNAIVAGTYSRLDVINGFFNSVEFDGVVAPVVRLYFALFLRVPDYNGLVFNVGLIKNGSQTLQSLADFFTASPEFQAMYGTLDNTQFVTLLYSNVLGRAPDAAGLAGWVSLLQSGYTRGQVMLGFSESVEYKAKKFNEVYVTMMYVGMLRRSPEPAGYSGWLAYLNTPGNTPQSMINGFYLSTEYHNRFLP
jgi:hypothetical protein